MSKSPHILDLFVSILALSGGIFIGIIDQRATEEVVTLGLLLALNLFVGALAPAGAWRWPLLSSIGVPLLSCYHHLNDAVPNPHLPLTVPSYALLAAVVLSASAAGVSLGVLLRLGAEMATRPLPEQ